MSQRKISIATVAYGQKYLDYYNQLALPSVQADIIKLREDGWEVSITLYENFLSMIEGETDHGREGFYTFMLPPDTVWSYGSLYNLAMMSEHLDVAIAVPHFRVSDTFKCALPVSPDTLLRISMSHPHKTFIESFDTLPENQCHYGYSLRWITKDLLTMRHNMPSIAMVRLNPRDAEMFLNYPFLEKDGIFIEPCTQWDRGFLNKVVEENRLKVIGSSDMATCVELTDADITNEKRVNNFNDKHCFGNPEHDLCRSMVYVMRFA
jgi:hypothetical protein